MITLILSLIAQIIFAFQPIGVASLDCDCDQDTCHVCESEFRNWSMREFPEALARSHETPVGECMCFECFHEEVRLETADEFTALFNSYETKWSKNGRMMIRQGDSGSFKFAKRA